MTGPADLAAERQRKGAYGEHRKASPVDRFGVWLSARAVTKHVELDGADLADLGCGYKATFTSSVLPRVKSATLVDLSLDPAFDADPKVRRVEAGIGADGLPQLADASFDVVLLLSVLEHLAEPEIALSEIHRILRPGGKALINVPSWRGKYFLELAAFRLGVSPEEEMDDHKRYYDPRDLWPMLVAAGFRPKSIHCKTHKFGLNTFAVCERP